MDIIIKEDISKSFKIIWNKHLKFNDIIICHLKEISEGKYGVNHLYTYIEDKKLYYNDIFICNVYNKNEFKVNSNNDDKDSYNNNYRENIRSKIINDINKILSKLDVEKLLDTYDHLCMLENKK